MCCEKTEKTLSRRKVITGLSKATLGASLGLAVSGEKASQAYAANAFPVNSILGQGIPGATPLHCSAFAKSGNFFVKRNFKNLDFTKGKQTLVLNSQGQVVYEYNLQSGEFPLINPFAKRPPIDPFSGLQVDIPQIPSPLMRLSAKDSLGQTAFLEFSAKLRTNLPFRPTISVIDSVDVRAGYEAFIGSARVTESVSRNNVRIGNASLNGIFSNPLLFTSVFNPELFSDVYSPGIIADLFIALDPPQSANDTVSDRGCLSCIFEGIAIEFKAAASGLFFIAAAVTTGGVAVALGLTAGGFGAAGALAKEIADFIKECRGACAD